MRPQILLLIYSIFTIFLISIVLINSIPENVLSKKLDHKKLVFSITPQGWAFFTRNPREGQAILYQKENGVLKKLPFQHNHYRFVFGLNRSVTKIYTELSHIKDKIPNHLFKGIEWNYQSDIYQKDLSILNTFHTKTPLQNNILKGEYLLVIQEPIPWAWSSHTNTIKMPAVAIFINIKD